MKNKTLNNPIGRLRVIGIAEGISFLLLLGVAMPLKYMAGIAEAVKIPGWIHGLLFILYIIALLNAAVVRRWPWQKITLGFLASLFPFGPFLLDPRLRKEEKEAAAATL